MANSWKHFESCVDLKKPLVQKGSVATYQLVLENKNLESRKIDADKVKQQNKLTHKIADAFFFIWEKGSEHTAGREKVIIVETKGTAFVHAINQLASSHAMLRSLQIEIHGRIVGRGIPAAVKKNKEYLALQQLFKGKVKTRSTKMVETFISFEQSTIQ